MDKVRHSAGIWTSRAQHVTCNTCSVCRKHGCLRAASAQWPTLIPAVSQLNPQHIVLPASNPRTLSCSGPAGDQGSAQTPTQEPLTFNPKTCTRERPSADSPASKTLRAPSAAPGSPAGAAPACAASSGPPRTRPCTRPPDPWRNTSQLDPRAVRLSYCCTAVSRDSGSTSGVLLSSTWNVAGKLTTERSADLWLIINIPADTSSRKNMTDWRENKLQTKNSEKHLMFQNIINIWHPVSQRMTPEWPEMMIENRGKADRNTASDISIQLYLFYHIGL